MNANDAAEYSESLGQIGEGWWRQIAWAFRQSIPELLGMTRREWVLQYHGYLRMPIIDRREAVAELVAQGMSTRQIADALGVGKSTIAEDLDALGVRNRTTDADETDEVDAEPEAAVRNRTADDGDEWYTPRWLFDALGLTFSIDVCAPLDRTHSAVPARRFFTVEDDGLAHPWQGTVWCNPPYSSPEPWARRLIHHGDGLLLTHVPINGGWFIDVQESLDAARFLQAMEFVRPDGRLQRPAWWLVLAAYGETAFCALADLQPLGRAAGNKRWFSPLFVRHDYALRPVG